ncbi:sigma factor regulator [Ureibacillus xyleni]|uniref:Sigma factor regulator n=1 Tax=Ureibacillus xyleni TaxID=614648 RepID=A0A285TU12_9BACL|nr:anti sigma factor C-terminal domain-containing protein [Ureibacillus xyleni]SOC25146.1 sigma factor regulator [Ureibacillus xyleni]
MNEFPDEMFDEKKIKKAIKKGKIKTLITIILVSLVVFIVLSLANFAISAHYSEKAFKKWDAYVRLSTPNGYISETVDSRGLLGGTSNYKISKDFKYKSIVIEQKQYSFGLLPSVLISRGSGGGIGITGEDWQFSYKENGWREMMFFHPNVQYKKYKNDEELLKNMQGDNLYEVALSFDKPYKLNDLPLFKLPEMTWFWLNTYSKSQLNTFQQEAKENDWSSTFIREHHALGFSINSPYLSNTDLEFEYENFLKLLQTSLSEDHQNAYNTMKNKKIEDVEILGIVVYGTRDELLDIMKNPIIKASSLGGVIDNY